jgi:DNA-directed RNA polymerase specialized sigma subunit
MKDIFADIQYRPLGKFEKSAIESAIVTGNLTIMALANRTGMEYNKKDVYRMVVAKGLKSHPRCVLQEISACQSLYPQEISAIKKVEEVKFRLLEGFVPRLAQLARRKLNMARCFSNADKKTLMDDLYSESISGFFHAVWRFNRYDIQFSTYLTVVVSNWLTEFCEKLSPIRMGEHTKKLLAEYWSIVNKTNQKMSFDDIMRIIVIKHLQSQGIDDTEINIQTALERQHLQFLELQQVFHKTVQVNETLTGSYSVNTDAILNEVIDKLSPLQKKIVKCKMDGVPIKHMIRDECLDRKEVANAYQKVRDVFGKLFLHQDAFAM